MGEALKNSSPEEEGQADYNQKLGLLRGLYGKDKLEYELAAHEELGFNSLKLLLNRFGYYDAGWVDGEEYDAAVINRLIAFNRQDIVSTNAISKAVFRRVYSIEKSVKTTKWLVAGIFILNIIFLCKFL